MRTKAKLPSLIDFTVETMAPTPHDDPPPVAVVAKDIAGRHGGEPSTINFNSFTGLGYDDVERLHQWLTDWLWWNDQYRRDR